jgi:type IV pilus assembly protein PilP
MVLVGCGGDASGPAKAEAGKEPAAAANRKSGGKPPPKARASKAKAASESGSESVAVSFTYDPTGKRDPFRSYEWERPDGQDSDARTPLEQFDVSQLSLVGVVWKTGNARALVQDPTGQGYIVAEGTRIGKNEGRIIEIDDNRVVVKETYVDYLGQKTTKDVEMRMRRSEGG